MEITVRKARIDDLPTLRALWRQTLLPVDQLEKTFTEFFVLCRADGVILAALGVRQFGWHALLHSEAYLSPAKEDLYRHWLWTHLQEVARRHGIIRFWISEARQSPWVQFGFVQASDDELARLPEQFANCSRASWYTYALVDDHTLEQAAQINIQALRAELDRERDRWQKWGTLWKATALAISLAILIIALWLFLQTHFVSRLPR